MKLKSWISALCRTTHFLVVPSLTLATNSRSPATTKTSVAMEVAVAADTMVRTVTKDTNIRHKDFLTDSILTDPVNLCYFSLVSLYCYSWIKNLDKWLDHLMIFTILQYAVLCSPFLFRTKQIRPLNLLTCYWIIGRKKWFL